MDPEETSSDGRRGHRLCRPLREQRPELHQHQLLQLTLVFTVIYRLLRSQTRCSPAQVDQEDTVPPAALAAVVYYSRGLLRQTHSDPPFKALRNQRVYFLHFTPLSGLFSSAHLELAERL